jgi:type VI secretion system protein ImpH
VSGANGASNGALLAAPGPEGLDAAALAARIEEARRRGAYPLLLLLERVLGPGACLGTAATPDEERIRLRHDARLAFRPGEVSAVRVREASDGGPHVEITTAFLGLSGAASPLPPYLDEEVAQEDEETPRRRDFLDLFHHRFISLFWRARARGDWPNAYRSDQSDPWSRRLLAFLGRERTPRVPRWRLLRWAPLLAERAVTPRALEAAIADVIEKELGPVGVAVEPFAGGWADLDPVDLNELGRARSRLGRDLLLGRRILDRGGRIRVVLGPLSREGLSRVRRSGTVLREIADALAELCPATLEREVVLWLSREAAPQLALGTARLGRDSWLGGQVRETRLPVELPA